jgi:hypothetical protein
MWRFRTFEIFVLLALVSAALGQQSPVINVRFTVTAPTVKERVPHTDLVKLERSGAEAMATLLSMHFGFLGWAGTRDDFRVLGVLGERSISGAPELYITYRAQIRDSATVIPSTPRPLYAWYEQKPLSSAPALSAAVNTAIRHELASDAFREELMRRLLWHIPLATSMPEPIVAERRVLLPVRWCSLHADRDSELLVVFTPPKASHDDEMMISNLQHRRDRRGLTAGSVVHLNAVSVDLEAAWPDALPTLLRTPMIERSAIYMRRYVPNPWSCNDDLFEVP